MSAKTHLGREAARLAAVVVVAGMVFAASVLTFERFGASRLANNSVGAPSGTCLLEVPASAVFSYYGNSTLQGYSVTFANGTEVLFPFYSCPVPVTPDNYRLDSAIEANPKFVAAADGSTYMATNACNCNQSVDIVSDNGSRWTVLNFVRYTGQRIYPCGPESYWAYNRTGLIYVTIPINSTGGLELSEMEVQGGPGNNNFYSCPTITTVGSGQTP